MTTAPLILVNGSLLSPAGYWLGCTARPDLILDKAVFYGEFPNINRFEIVSHDGGCFALVWGNEYKYIDKKGDNAQMAILSVDNRDKSWEKFDNFIGLEQDGKLIVEKVNGIPNCLFNIVVKRKNDDYVKRYPIHIPLPRWAHDVEHIYLSKNCVVNAEL